MLKQHNIENADIPKPFEELAPEPLIQQHKAVVQAETDAKNARAATSLIKKREKVGGVLATVNILVSLWFRFSMCHCC